MVRPMTGSTAGGRTPVPPPASSSSPSPYTPGWSLPPIARNGGSAPDAIQLPVGLGDISDVLALRDTPPRAGSKRLVVAVAVLLVLVAVTVGAYLLMR